MLKRCSKMNHVFFYQHFKIKDFITPIISQQSRQSIQLQHFLIYTDNYLYKYWNNEYTINILTILSWIPTVRLSMATNPSPITLKNVPPLWKKKHINNLIFFLCGGGRIRFYSIYYNHFWKTNKVNPSWTLKELGYKEAAIFFWGGGPCILHSQR